MSSAAFALLLAACAEAPRAPDASAPAPALPPPERPARCREVAPGTPLAPLLVAASAGDVFCLAPGPHDGPLVIPAGVHVWGSREAIVKGGRTGTTVRLAGAGARLEGVTVDGSGTRFDTLDAAVKIEADDGAVVGVRVVRATFGILSERARRVRIAGCDVEGSGGPALGLRGDAIRLWETRDSAVEHNRVHGSRDLVVWYSSDNRVAHNVATGGRYGTHLMYSHRNEVLDNRYVGNVVGVFVMYSRDVRLERNLVADSAGAAGVGLGVKDSGNLTVTENVFVHNTMGVYLDNSPQQSGDRNLFERNVFRLGQEAVVFHGGTHDNHFRDNTFRDNPVQVRVEGGGDALGVAWEGNDFDDYRGYDLDADGTGDVAYELRSLSGDVVSRTPELAFFAGTPALGLVEAVGRAVPIFAPKLVLRDARPRMGALAEEAADAH